MNVTVGLRCHCVSLNAKRAWSLCVQRERASARERSNSEPMLNVRIMCITLNSIKYSAAYNYMPLLCNIYYRAREKATRWYHSPCISPTRLLLLSFILLMLLLLRCGRERERKHTFPVVVRSSQSLFISSVGLFFAFLSLSLYFASHTSTQKCATICLCASPTRDMPHDEKEKRDTQL